MNSLEKLAEMLITETEAERRKISKAVKILEELGAEVIIPEMRIKGKEVIGVGIKGNVAYVVEPNGMEEEIKRLFKVEKVVIMQLMQGPLASANE